MDCSLVQSCSPGSFNNCHLATLCNESRPTDTYVEFCAGTDCVMADGKYLQPCTDGRNCVSVVTDKNTAGIGCDNPVSGIFMGDKLPLLPVMGEGCELTADDIVSMKDFPDFDGKPDCDTTLYAQGDLVCYCPCDDDPCPPPPNCPTVMLMCEGLFTPMDDNGCTVGCPTCPELPPAPCPVFRCANPNCDITISAPIGDDGCPTGCPTCPSPPPSPPPSKKSSPPPLPSLPPSPYPRVNNKSPSVDVIAECDPLVGAITITDRDSNGFKLEHTDEPCRIHDGMLYHGMWEPSNYDVVDTIKWIDPDFLPCAKQWFAAGDLVCYCPCDQNKHPPRPFDPIAPPMGKSPSPSPPREEDKKSPSPSPPREEDKKSPSPSPPREEDKKSPSPSPPREEDKKSPSPPPPREEDKKSPSPPPPREEDKKSPSPPPAGKSPSSPPPTEKGCFVGIEVVPEGWSGPSPYDACNTCVCKEQLACTKMACQDTSPKPDTGECRRFIATYGAKIIGNIKHGIKSDRICNFFADCDADNSLVCSTCHSVIEGLSQQSRTDMSIDDITAEICDMVPVTPRPVASRVQRTGTKWSDDIMKNRDILSKPAEFAQILDKMADDISKLKGAGGSNVAHTEKIRVDVKYTKYSELPIKDEEIVCNQRPLVERCAVTGPVNVSRRVLTTVILYNYDVSLGGYNSTEVADAVHNVTNTAEEVSVVNMTVVSDQVLFDGFNETEKEAFDALSSTGFDVYDDGIFTFDESLATDTFVVFEEEYVDLPSPPPGDAGDDLWDSAYMIAGVAVGVVATVTIAIYVYTRPSQKETIDRHSDQQKQFLVPDLSDTPSAPPSPVIYSQNPIHQ